MGWETRNRRGRYYTRSIKSGGRVIRKYIGSGLKGLLAASFDEEVRANRKAKREAFRIMQSRDKSHEAVFIGYCRQVDGLMAETLNAAGCYNHRGQWRRVRGEKGYSTMNSKQLLDLSRVQNVEGLLAVREEVHRKVEEANTGDQQAETDLLLGCNQNPEYCRVLSGIGDLAYRALDQRLHQLWGKSARGMRLATHSKVAELEKEIVGENPSPLEKLLAERIVMCWVDVQDQELRYGNVSNESNSQQFEWRSRMLDRAHKRYLSAIKALATVRRLNLPIVQLNIGENQLNMVGGGDGAKHAEAGVVCQSPPDASAL